MDNLPRLVQEIIDWYQWKDRMRKINAEFLYSFRVLETTNYFQVVKVFYPKGENVCTSYKDTSKTRNSSVIHRFDLEKSHYWVANLSKNY